MRQHRRCTYGLISTVGESCSWFPRVRSHREPDLRIVLGDLERYGGMDDVYSDYARRPRTGSPEASTVRIERATDGHFRISYFDGAQFIIDEHRSQVFGISRSALTMDDLVVYLQGPIFGFLLRLRGVTCLHASAVGVEGRAFAIVGQGGMGKSTSAATFARMGLTIFTDDVLALDDSDDGFQVQPGLPRVLLWPESSTAIFGDAEALPRIVSNWDKRYLDLMQPGYNFATEPAPLNAIYVLGERLEATAQTIITEMRGSDALMRLVANTHANDFLDGAMRATELEVLTRLVNQVPIKQVRAPRNRESVPFICEAILEDALSLKRHG